MNNNMSTKIPFIFHNLKIYKIPGFPKGLEGYSELAPGINIIAGPNASGKSSTARLIQKLVWRNKTEGIHAEGSATVGKELWTISIDSGYNSTRHNGNEEELAGIPSSEEQNRYMLALHELVSENEDELARKIIAESIGGYDPGMAAKNLNYASQVRNKGVGEFRNYEESNRKFREIQEEHNKLKQQENHLGSLYEEKEKASMASRLRELYDLVIQYLKSKTDLENKTFIYNAFPKSLEKASGQEYIEIKDLGREIEALQIDIEKAENTIAGNNIALSGLKLPADGIADEVLYELDGRINTLSGLEGEIRKNHEANETSLTLEKEALDSIDKDHPPSGWQGINLKDISGLDRFIEKAQKLIIQKQQYESAVRELEQDYGDDQSIHSGRLNDGISALSNWLQEEHSSAGFPAWTVYAMAAIAALTGISVFYAGWYGLSCLLLIGIVWWFARAGNRITGIREKDYRKTGLDEPESWTVEKVAAKLDILTGDLALAKTREKNTVRAGDLKKQLEKLETQLDEIARTRNEWLEKLKAVPELPGDDLDTYMGLYWFLDRVKTWMVHHEKTNTLTTAGDILAESYRSELEKINLLFRQYSLPSAADAASAKALFRKSESDENKRKDLVKETESLNREIRAKEKQIDANESKLKQIYEKLEVETGHAETIRHLTDQLKDYKIAGTEYSFAERVYVEMKHKMESHPLYPGHEKEIENIGTVQAAEYFRQYSQDASQLAVLQEEITQIETRISDHKKGHNLEDAIREKEAAAENLERLFEENLSSVTGNLIIDRLKKETSEKNTSAVFKRAGQLLKKITRGRYDLLLPENGEPAFGAFDNTHQRGQSLNELSTGTRIQLLLAVRLAYIETRESVMKLPILADELLANSDDVRASAIMDALTEISREGRQIFYFTAQDDEVARWQSHLSGSGDDQFKIIKLTGSSPDDPAPAGIPTVPAFIHEVPQPGNAGHSEYGRMLGVHPFNILTGNPSELHPWYFMDDNERIYQLLTSGIRSFGQLESLVLSGEEINAVPEESWKKIREKVAVLTRYLELYHTGRSKTIDREILGNSGAVNPGFIDKVSALLQSLSGDPVKLVEALRNSQVKGFRHDKTENLEEYLVKEGFIDQRPKLSSEETTLLMNAFLSRQEIDPGMAESFLKRIVNAGVENPEENERSQKSSPGNHS